MAKLIFLYFFTIVINTAIADPFGKGCRLCQEAKRSDYIVDRITHYRAIYELEAETLFFTLVLEETFEEDYAEGFVRGYAHGYDIEPEYLSRKIEEANEVLNSINYFPNSINSSLKKFCQD